ncbi:TasA family protein [Thermococcus sp. 21S7]|uniref:TasA family protein n=1 Tax=Thermococcus sp. 21S7 TaxID=1638221 RepID=UPI001439B8F1|nr:TasA family protein [Thermococcus sp. 21S7]NJE62135.1 methyltransferase [Thermococcus sp. 21S7]
MKHAGVVAVGVLAAILVLAGPAKSLFTDTALSENNGISSGEFDIAISKDGSKFYNDAKLFEFSDLKPGEERTFSFYVKNRGDVDVSRLTMTLYIRDLEEGTMSPAEKAVDNTTDVGELSGYLIVKELRVYLGRVSWTVDSVRGRSLKELGGKGVSLIDKPLREGERLRVTMTVEFSKEAGNECQTDRVLVNMKLSAEQ